VVKGALPGVRSDAAHHFESVYAAIFKLMSTVKWPSVWVVGGGTGTAGLSLACPGVI